MNGRIGNRGRQAAGLVALTLGLIVLALLPLGSLGSERPERSLEKLTGALAPVTGDAEGLVETTAERLRRLRKLREARLREAVRQPPEPVRAQAVQQEDPKTQPPLHGTNPHGQGTVGTVDLQPSAERPAEGDPAAGEEVVVGRARGEQREDGSYRGHITIVALFGNEILGVDTGPGQSANGPLNAVQEGVLTPLCNGTANQVCVSAATADSNTTDSGSTNRFSAARVTLGGPQGIDAGVAESNGNISDDGNCQVSHGDSSVATASVGGQSLAGVARSSTDSRACKDGTQSQNNSSSFVEVGGTGVPLPAAGCATGEPDVVTGIPTVAPIVCNADDVNTTQAGAPYGVREALGVYVLDVGGTPLSKATTAGSESRAVAPPAQCADGADNDGDGVADSADPGCHTDGNPNNPGSYTPNDDSEVNAPAQCSDTTDNDGDGVADSADPGCHTDGDASNPATYDPNDNDETNARRDDGGPRDERDRGDGGDAECADGRDNDGDGVADARDPDCHTDGDPNNPDSYDPNDDSEAGGGPAECADGRDNDGDGDVDFPADDGCDSRADDSEGSASRVAGVALPRTGSDVLILVMAGLLLVGLGGELRRRLALGIRTPR